MEYRAPDQENVRGHVQRKAREWYAIWPLNPLIASEIETATGKQHHDSAISPANYTREPLG